MSSLALICGLLKPDTDHWGFTVDGHIGWDWYISILHEEDLREPFDQLSKGRISINMALFEIIHN